MLRLRGLIAWLLGRRKPPLVETVPAARPDIRIFPAVRRDVLNDSLVAAMRQVAPHEWTSLYRSFRDYDLRLEDVSRFASLPADTAVELLGVATLNGDGYVRQAALECWVQAPHPRAAPFALLRLNDWVGPVRDAAERVIDRLIDAGHAEAFVRHHLLLDHLQRMHRGDVERIRGRILEHLRTATQRPMLLNRLGAADEAERRFIYELLRQELTADAALQERALADPSPWVRASVAEHLARPDGGAGEAVLGRLLADPAEAVRLAVLRWLPTPLPSALTPLVTRQLFANSAALRDAARFLLRRSGIDDFRRRYRAAVTSETHPREMAGAIAGLGETGDAADAPLARPHLGASSPRIRAAAVLALARLDPAASRDVLVRALEDRSGRVRRAAVAGLADALDAETAAAALDVMRRGPAPVCRSAFRLVAMRGGWEAAPALLLAVSSRDAALRERAWPQIASLHAHLSVHGWLRPDDATRRLLRDVVREVEAAAPQPPRACTEAFHSLLRSAQAAADGR